ncbi:probable general amino acid permease [Phialocephala subalpina]|uniref:Probable general amino acid permease n=1 Tax=Phialocephala subalpina TaxID=576137 RepID=A0A1L7WKC8_9HELO|nr:probable general amino acid permease [Phialocephala subalpina]
MAADDAISKTPTVETPKCDVEKGSHHEAAKGIRRDLKGRHINMIAIAGMIGTGLFLASGKAIARAGPVGALLGYIFMGAITSGVSFTSGELSAFMPLTGGFVRHATKFIDPAMGAAIGWNFWYSLAITCPAELSAAATVIQFWRDDINPAVWLSIFIVVITIINFCGVRIYGESEVIFACIKIALIIGLIIAGIVVDLGGGPDYDRIGFRYWRDPGAFNEYLVGGTTGRFLAIWSILISAAFSYGNIQVTTLAGAETANPRKIIPQATKKTFYRVLLFYVLSIFVVGLIVRYDDKLLQNSTGTAQQSPFVIAFQRAGIKVLPSIINAVVCTSAFSSGSACIFLASRILYGLSQDGQAPKFFQKCNRFGTPYLAVAASLLLTPLVYLSVGTNSSIVFGWFVNITTVSGLTSWVVIEWTYLRFYWAMQVQGYSRDKLRYQSPFQPYLSWTTMFSLIVIIFFSGFDIFFPGGFTATGFLSNYINIPIFASLYIFFRFFFYKSSIIPLEEINLADEFSKIEEEKAARDENVYSSRSWASKLYHRVF